MGEGNSKCNGTVVANGYDSNIKACIKGNKIEIQECESETKVKLGFMEGSAGVGHRTRTSISHTTYDPGFTTITPGSHFVFSERGDDGHVFVTIKIGYSIPIANVQVQNDTNVIVDKNGSLQNAAKRKIWKDPSGHNHFPPEKMSSIQVATQYIVTAGEKIGVSTDTLRGGLFYCWQAATRLIRHIQPHVTFEAVRRYYRRITQGGYKSS